MPCIFIIALLATTCVSFPLRLQSSSPSFHLRSSEAHRAGHAKRIPSPVNQVAGAPTPAPTGAASSSTTVHINTEGDFALLLPRNPGGVYTMTLFIGRTPYFAISERRAQNLSLGVISDAEGEAVSFCYGSRGCANTMPPGFITGAHVTTAGNGRWIQAHIHLSSFLLHFC